MTSDDNDDNDNNDDNVHTTVFRTHCLFDTCGRASQRQYQTTTSLRTLLLTAVIPPFTGRRFSRAIHPGTHTGWSNKT